MSDSGNFQSEVGGFLKGALIGGLIGVGLGVLLAPEEGKKIQDKLREKTKQLKKDSEQVVRVAKRISDEFQIPDRLSEVSGEFQKQARVVKKKADELWGDYQEEPMQQDHSPLQDSDVSDEAPQVDEPKVPLMKRSFFKRVE